MSELLMLIDKDHQLIKAEHTETAFGAPVVPLRVEFSTQKSPSTRKTKKTL
jgi:hypothetical protein